MLLNVKVFEQCVYKPRHVAARKCKELHALFPLRFITSTHGRTCLSTRIGYKTLLKFSYVQQSNIFTENVEFLYKKK